MPIPRRFPFVARNFMNLKSDLDRIYDEFFGEEEGESQSSYIPRVNLEETDQAYIVTAELPGVEKDDVSITFQDNKLYISGNKQAAKNENKENFLRYERVFGRFNRHFHLPADIQSKHIDAEFKNGVLTITLPKVKKSGAQKINIDIK